MRQILASGAVLISCALGLAACGGGSSGSGSFVPDPDSNPGGNCASPLAAEARDYALTVDVPSDFDSTASPMPTPSTVINFSVLLPRRCPGQSFPLVLQSHGYSGTRETAIGPDGTLAPDEAHFPSINTLVRALPHRGYVVISYDERGHGTAAPGQAAHNARIIDPAAETQDAIALLDWAWDNPALSFAQQESGTGIAKDLRVGTIGYSYGGGFEMPLALLDARIDTIVPNGTWHNLLYSLLPGDGLKLGFGSLLCTLAIQGNVNNTPLVANLCSLVGPTGPSAVSLRTRVDLIGAASSPVAQPRPAADSDELTNFFYTHGTGWFESAARDGKTIVARDRPAVVRPTARRAIPALFIQGQRDTLFNLTDAYRNYVYFKAAGADVRLLGTEGGHMNPLAQQVEGTANCGAVVGVEAVMAWFDQKLKGLASPTYNAIPKVCISVTPTPAAGEAPTNDALSGVRLADVPVGSLSGTGAIPASATLSASVSLGGAPVFQPVTTIAQAGAVLAGIPRVQRVSVSAGVGAVVTPVAYVGVGIQRGGELILVDDEVTPFAMLAPDSGTTDCASGPVTDHCHNRGASNATILLPGVGELLQLGDQVGLIFYENHVQYLPANSGGAIGLPNPYNVTMTNVELPILLPCPNSTGCLAGSSLSTP